MKQQQLALHDIGRLKMWRWSSFFSLLIGYTGYYLCRKNISAAFPLLEDEFGFSNTQLGYIALFSEVTYAAGKFINGPLGDRIGGKKVFLLGMFGTILGNIFFTQVNTLTMFIVAWCVTRYFLSMGWGGMAKVMGAWYGKSQRGTLMGFLSLSFQFGGVIAVALAGYLVSQGVGWKGIFYTPAAILFVIFFLVLFGLKDSPESVIPGAESVFNDEPDMAKYEGDDKSASGQTMDPIAVIKALFKLPIFNNLLLFSFLTTFLRSIFFFWTPKILADSGMENVNAIFTSAVFPLLGCLGTVFLGWYTDRYAKNGDRARMMYIMLTGLTVSLAAICIMLTTSSMSSSMLVGLLGLSGFFLLGPYSMSSGCLALDIAGSKGAGSCTGMIDGVGYLGGALAVGLAGYLSDKLGWSGVFMALTVAGAASTYCAFKMSQAFRRAK